MQMSQNRAYERAEVEEAFRKMSTFKDDTIEVCDLAKFYAALGFIHTKEQFEQYYNFVVTLLQGKVPMELAVAGLAVHKDITKLLKVYIDACDRDKNGFIDEGEFEVMVKVVLHHDPSFGRMDFDRFVKEADINKDGKVSKDEAFQWFIKNAKL